jgi:hypothetical protein
MALLYMARGKAQQNDENTALSTVKTITLCHINCQRNNSAAKNFRDWQQAAKSVSFGFVTQ